MFYKIALFSNKVAKSKQFLKEVFVREELFEN